MVENKSKAFIEIPKQKRNLFFIATYCLFAGFSASGYGSGVLLPAQLTAMNGLSLYPLGGALGTLGMMLSLPLVGKLSDKFGSKTIILFGVFMQLIARVVLMGVSSSLGLYLVLYTVQNIGGGLFLAAPYSLITDVTEPAERPKYFGLLVSFRALGSLTGPLLTGALIDSGYSNLGWLSYIPFMVIAVPVIMVFYPNIKAPDDKNERFDFIGVLFLVLSICCIVLWLCLGGKFFDWLSPASVALISIGVLSLIGLIRRETRHPNPAVPLNVFRHKRFTVAFLCQFLLCAYNTCASAYVIAFAQQIMQVSSTVSSTVTIPQTIVQALFSAVIGRWIGKNFAKRFRPLALMGILLTALAMFLFYTMSASTSMVLIYAATAIGGFGSIIPQTTYTPFFQSDIQPDEYRPVQNMYSFASSSGSCVFGAVVGVMMNAGATYNHVFLMAAGLCAAALIVGLIGFNLPKEASVQT